MNKKRIILIAVAAVIIVGGGVWLFGGAKAKHKVTYATATIHKGEISESVTATGIPKYRLPLPKRVTKVICRKMQSMTLPRKLKVCLR